MPRDSSDPMISPEIFAASRVGMGGGEKEPLSTILLSTHRANNSDVRVGDSLGTWLAHNRLVEGSLKHK